MARKVLIVGAAGSLGVASVAAFLEAGFEVRALDCRGMMLEDDGVEGLLADALDPEALRGCCDDVDVVLVASGASVRTRFGGRRAYSAVDVPIARNLAAEMTGSPVTRIIYISVAHSAAMEGLDYIAAHNRAAELLRATGIPTTVVHSTGHFSAMLEFLDLARRPVAPIIGTGLGRTNPIDQRDLAEFCVRVVAMGPGDAAVGGPEVHTRADIQRLAFEALGRPVRTMRVPAWSIRAAAAVMRPLHPRLSALMAFGASVCTTDCVAPAFGSRTLRAYFEEAVAASSKGRV